MLTKSQARTIVLLVGTAGLVVGLQSCASGGPAPGSDAPLEFPERRAGLFSYGAAIPGHDATRAWQDVHAAFGISGWKHERSDSEVRVARFYLPSERLRSYVRLEPKVVDGRYILIDVEMLVEQLPDSAGTPPLGALRLGEIMSAVGHRIGEQAERR